MALILPNNRFTLKYQFFGGKVKSHTFSNFIQMKEVDEKEQETLLKINELFTGEHDWILIEWETNDS